MSKFDEIKRQEKQAAYDLRVEQYQQVSQALLDNLSPSDKPKLQKQQRDLEAEIRKLESDIEKLDAKLKKTDPIDIVIPTPRVAKRQETEAVRLAEAEARTASQPRPTGRLINSLRYRYDASMPFYGRDQEQATIQEYIRRGERLITIHARPGAGKTALASKVLGDLAQSAELVTGIVALTAGEAHHQVSLDRILSDFGRLLPEGALSFQASDPVREKVIGLLNTLQGGRYVLLLDNFESLLDDNHVLQDADLQALFTVVLERGGLTILLTTRYRPRLERTLVGHERPIPLDEGLLAEDALKMLRGLDKTGLLPSDDQPLYMLIERVNGFPRALEATIGLLADSRSVTFEDLLKDTALFEGEVTREIVEKALATLPPLMMRVMEALALYKQPVPLAAVEYLLAPYVDWTNIRVRDVLDRLIDRHFVSYPPATRLYGLHPLDQSYCEKQTPEGTPEDAHRIDAVVGMNISTGKRSANVRVDDSTPPYTRYALLGRAARYYQTQRKPEKEWKTLADLEPQLSEFRYRIRLGDYDTAANLLYDFDFKYLMLWGHFRLMATLHESLLGNIKDRFLQSYHLGNLGNAYTNLGEMRKGLQYYEQALFISREIGNKSDEGVWLGNLGIVYRALGALQKAVETYEQALAIRRKVGYREGEADTLGNLGLAYRDLGDAAKAIEYYEQALAINSEIGDKHGEGINLGNLGHTLTEAGDYQRGVEALHRSLFIADEIQYPGMKNFMGAYLARAYLLQGDLSAAQQAIEAARQHDVPENNHHAAALHGVIVLRSDNPPVAQTAFTDALTFADALLKQPQTGYAVRYGRALARAGLSLITNGAFDDAKADYEAALAQCSAKGVVQRELRLLQELAKAANGERLKPLIDLLRGTLE